MRLRTFALGAALLIGACQQSGGAPGNSAAGGAASGATNETAEPGTPQQPANDTQAADDAAGVTLAAQPAAAEEGATMTLTLNNGSGEQIGYNLCTSALETSDGRAVPTANVCTMELRTLAPGATADYRYKLPVNMPDGSYRFMTQVERMPSGGRTGIRSNPFEVR